MITFDTILHIVRIGNQHALAFTVDDVAGLPTTVESAGHRAARPTGADARVLANDDISKMLALLPTNTPSRNVGCRLPFSLPCARVTFW